MGILLAGHTAVTGGSRVTEVGQKRLQRFERGRIDARLAKRKRGAEHRIEHPGRHHRHDPGQCLDMDVLDAAAELAVEPTDDAAVERMPAVVDRDGRVDMGIMITSL